MTRLKGARTPVSRWLWLLLLLLLLGLAGFYLLRGNRASAALTVTAPAEGASLSGPVTVSGTGKAGQTVTVSENGASVTTVQVGQDGTFSASLPASSAGSHTYSVSESGSQAALSRTVTVEASAPSATETPAPGTDPGSTAQPASGTDPAASGGAAPSTSVDGTAPSSDTQTPDASDQTPAAVDPAAPATGQAPAPADQATPADGNLSIATPSGGVNVPAGTLTLRGNGPANTSLTVTEDGTDLGQAQTDASGAWTFQVPSPAPGPHTYRVAAGGATSDLQLTVAGGSAAAATNCSEAFSLSLKDGQQVSSPFRFGGTGSGQAYLVTVFRGDRQIGQKLLPLDSSCNWSYTSRPGPGRVTYTLRGQGQTEVAGEVTLDVLR